MEKQAQESLELKPVTLVNQQREQEEEENWEKELVKESYNAAEV